MISNTWMRRADGSTPIAIRWVLVVDPTGKLDPLPLMSADPLMTPERMIELFVDRWGLEVTFEQTGEHLRVETQRQWADGPMQLCMSDGRSIGTGRFTQNRSNGLPPKRTHHIL